MRRIISLIAALIMCAAVMCPLGVRAEEFVPSIGYKDGPDIIDAEMEDEDVTECIIITSILAAEEKTTDIEQEERDLLLEVYEELSDGTMELPLPEDYVVRELVDIDFRQSECVETDHVHEEELEREEVTITIDLEMGVKPGTDVVVLVYRDGEWKPIKSVVNNGDGTLTCEFDFFCPVAFCVRDGGDGPAQTGDTMGDMVYVWAAVLVAALVALVLLLVIPKLRKKR